MRTLLGLGLALAAISFPASTASAASYTDQFAGVEIPPVTSTLGTFTGLASGQLAGGWYAQIEHQPLSTGPTVAITGGSFTVYTISGRTVSGSVTGGTVTVTNPGSGCKNQTFAVSATLSDGSFTGTLMHYRFSLLGSCITYRVDRRHRHDQRVILWRASATEHTARLRTYATTLNSWLSFLTPIELLGGGAPAATRPRAAGCQRAPRRRPADLTSAST